MRYANLFMVFMILIVALGIGVPSVLSGVRVMVTIGWVVTAIFFMFWVFSRFGLVSYRIGIVFIILFLLFAILAYLGSTNVLQKAVAFCGDGVCAPAECDGTCSDCTVSMCEDNKCVIGFERCDTSSDCSCTGEFVCRPGEGANEQGCYSQVCGDGFCDPAETKINCCSDCGCKKDYTCMNNICFFDTPKVSFTTHVAAQEISVTSLSVNPFLINTSGTPLPLVLLRIRNEISDAYNVMATIQIGEYLELEHAIGTIEKGSVYPLIWYGPFNQSMMKITEDEFVNVTANVVYFDGQNVLHKKSWQSNITLLGRNKPDKFTHISYFVTPDDIELKGNSIKNIWRQFQSLEILDEQPGTQFPLETIERGAGDPDDIALVLVSAFYKAGFRTGLVESDYGLFVRVWDDRYYKILDPEKLKENLDSAISEYPGYAVWDLPDIWEDLNVTPISLSSVLYQEG